MIRRLQRKTEVVHGENVFEKFRFLKIADAAGLARRIELVRQRVGADVEIVIVFRLVDAHAPQNDGRMVPVAANHAAHVVDGDQLPRLVADVLPAGNFLQHQQSDLVAGIEKVARLRIVRGAHDIALELVAQNLRVAALRAAGHGLADKGKGLMAVQAAQLDDFAVEFETVIGELGFAKTDGARDFVHGLRPAQQANLHACTDSGCARSHSLMAPRLSRWTVCATGSVAAGDGGTRCVPLASTRSPSRRLDFEGQRFSRRLHVLNEAIDIQAGMVGQHVLRLGENIFDEGRRERCAARLRGKCRRRSGSQSRSRREECQAARWSRHPPPARSLRRNRCAA